MSQSSAAAAEWLARLERTVGRASSGARAEWRRVLVEGARGGMDARVILTRFGLSAAEVAIGLASRRGHEAVAQHARD